MRRRECRRGTKRKKKRLSNRHKLNYNKNNMYQCFPETSVDAGGVTALKRSYNESNTSATFLFTTTSLEKKKKGKEKPERDSEE